MMETAWKYKPYPEYKESGVKWLGEIPEHWESIRIRHLSIVKRGASPRPIDDPKYFDDDGEYSWVRIADVTSSDRYLTQTTQRMSNFGKSLSVPMKPGDIFLSIAGSVGKPIITKIKCCIHDGFVYFPSYTGDKEFLYYIFSSGQPYLGLGKLGTQLNLNTDTVGNIHIGLPPTEEQQAIASFLDRETARIDELVAKKEQLIALLEEKRTALISHAVTKGLNPDAKMKDSGIEWLGEIPEHWEVLRSKIIFQETNLRSVSGDEKLLSVSHITGVTSRSEKNVNMFLAETLEGYKICKQGDLVINTMWAWMGALGISPLHGIVSPSYNVYCLRAQFVTPWYYDLLFRTERFRKEIIRHSKGIWSSRWRLYPESFYEIRIPVPPYEEQKKIVELLAASSNQNDNIILKNREVIEKLQEYRTALISAAVTGKIDVREHI